MAIVAGTKLIFDGMGGSASGAYIFKGSVSTYDDLETISDAWTEEEKEKNTGWVYNVTDTGKNYAWNGTAWDSIGGDFAGSASINITSSGGTNTITVAGAPGATANTFAVSNGTGGITWRQPQASDLSDVTASASEINVLDGITATTSELNILDGVTADANELNILDGATVTTAELNYVDGVTSPIQTQLNNKVPQYSSMPTASSEYANEIAQYSGATAGSYTNGYFYKCNETGTVPDSVTFTPNTGVSTVVTVSPADFVAFITPWCEGRPFGPSDVTHGTIGIYSSTQYAMTIETDDDNFAHAVFDISELEAAGFTFTPPFGAQEGATFVCSIGQSAYAWQQLDVCDIGNATITFKANGTTISGQSFTTNAKENVEIDLGNTGLVDDVKIDNTSIVSDKIATIPYATNAVAGAAKAGSGLASMAGGVLYIYPATDAAIQAKTNNANPIVPKNLDKAIKEGLGNYDIANNGEWTDAFKEHARDVIGATQVVLKDWD